MVNNLVSVIIVSYNSSLFIVETLESISRQTWKNLELIITDDCSKDDTVEICRNWLNKNSQRFTSSRIITSERNTGVSANANRGLTVSAGEWIKFLGADDTLKSKCIEENMLWISFRPEIRVLFSQIDIFRDTFDNVNLIKTTPGLPLESSSLLAPEKNAESQYKMLLVCDRMHFTPSVFIQSETLISVGGFDERFAMVEDYPLWLNLTKNKHKLYFMDKVTVNYRQHSLAANNTGLPNLVNPNYFKSEHFRRICTYPFLPFDVRLNQRFIWIVSQLFRLSLFNKDKKLNRAFLRLLTVYLNPFRYFIYFKKRITKNLRNQEFYD
jgi:glycosyltransferase involved in cell wall biosynthesis